MSSKFECFFFAKCPVCESEISVSQTQGIKISHDGYFLACGHWRVYLVKITIASKKQTLSPQWTPTVLQPEILLFCKNVHLVTKHLLKIGYLTAMLSLPYF